MLFCKGIPVHIRNERFGSVIRNFESNDPERKGIEPLAFQGKVVEIHIGWQKTINTRMLFLQILNGLCLLSGQLELHRQIKVTIGQRQTRDDSVGIAQTDEIFPSFACDVFE